MDLSKLNYSKPAGQKEPSDKIPDIQSDNTGTLIVDDKLSLDYTKQEPVVETTIVFIISGGSTREMNYFHPIKQDKNIRRIRIAFVSKENQGLKPYELKTLAEQFIGDGIFRLENGETIHIEPDDTIYLLQDMDEFGEELKGYLKGEPNIQSRWIISNPAFETWLFYHYFDNPSPLGHGLTLTEKDRSNWLKEHLPKIIPGGVQTTKAFFTVETAIANSEKNYSETEGMPSIYSTQMHHLAKNILQVMKNEYSEMIERRQKQIEQFRNRK